MKIFTKKIYNVILLKVWENISSSVSDLLQKHCVWTWGPWYLWVFMGSKGLLKSLVRESIVVILQQDQDNLDLSPASDSASWKHHSKMQKYL